MFEWDKVDWSLVKYAEWSVGKRRFKVVLWDSLGGTGKYHEKSVGVADIGCDTGNKSTKSKY